jgi:hypothetical protein
MEQSSEDSPVDYIVRLKINSLALSSLDGTPFSLPQYLSTRPSEQGIDDLLLLMKERSSHRPPLKTRLIIARKPSEIAEAERKRLHRKASRNQCPLGENALLAANFMILATSLDQEDVSTEGILSIYRLRWQIDIDQSWDLSRIRLREEGRICRWRQASPRRWRGADGPEGGDGLRVGVNQLDGPTAGGWNEAAG